MARQVTNEVETAWKSGKAKSVGNTRTDGISVFLHGNKIIWKDNGRIYFSFCGWATRTTVERINGILGTHFSFHKHELGLWHAPDANGKRIFEDIDPSDTFELVDGGVKLIAN